MGEKENNNNQNESPVTKQLRNTVLGVTMTVQLAMMNASRYRTMQKEINKKEIK